MISHCEQQWQVLFSFPYTPRHHLGLEPEAAAKSYCFSADGMPEFFGQEPFIFVEELFHSLSRKVHSFSSGMEMKVIAGKNAIFDQI
jgi:hypothetical protein